MIFLFYFCFCLSVIIFQSTVTPYLRLFDRMYDLLIPLFVYFGLFRSSGSSLPVIIICGFIMDSITGGPFGLYLTSYIWIYVGLRWLIRIFDISHSLLALFVVPMAVLFENFVILTTFSMWKQEPVFTQSATRIVSIQVLWAFFTGPLLLIGFDRIHKRWDRWIEKLEELKSG
jgi:cell shape-determining protein MreD